MTTETDTADAVADDALLLDDTADQQGQDTQPADDAGADTVEGGEGNDTPKPKQTAQERIDELTRARREAEREAEFWKSKAIPTKGPEPAPQPKADDRPDPAAYQFGETDPEFIEALGAFAARQEFKRLSAEQAQSQQVRTAQQADQDRRAAFAKDHPDFHDKIATKLIATDVMAEAMIDSEHGPAVAYHLANNPDEAKRIAGLSPVAQVRAIGAIEGRLAAPSTQTPAKTVSDAPPVLQTVRGAGGKFKAAPDTDDFASFDKAYD